MAEVIGLAASILTLASASAQLARTLLKVANIIESAEYEARLIAADISVFSSSLAQLRKVLDLACPETDKLREITVVLISACTTLIEDLSLLIGDSIPLNSARRAFLMPLLRLRFRWLMNGSKILFVKSMVDSFKTTIILLVSTMDLATEIHQNAPDSTTQFLMTQVESNIMFAEDATESLCRCKDCEDAQSETTSFLSLNTGSTAPKQIGSPTPGIEQALVLLRADLVPNSSDRELTLQSMMRHDQTTESHNEISTSVSTLDDMEYYLQLSHGCNRMIEVQQMSCALARTVLDNQVPPPGRAYSESHVHATGVERESATRNSAPPGSLSDIELTASPINGDVKDHGRHLDSPLRHHDHLSHQILPGLGVEQNAPPTASGDIAAVASTEDGLLKLIPLLPKPLNDYMEMQALNEDGEMVVPREHAQALPRKFQTAPSKNTTFTVPTPFIPTKEDKVFRGVGDLLLRKEKEKGMDDEYEDERREEENAGFDRLQRLPSAQQEAKMQKEVARKAVNKSGPQKISEIRNAITEIRNKEDENKIGKLYQLMLQQKEEQERRERALDAERKAAAEEKKAAAEKAKDLLDVAKASREDAERRAAVESAELQRTHEQATREAAEAHMKRKLAQEEQLTKTREDENDRRSAPVKFEDAIGRKFSCPWHLCKTWKGMEEFIQQISVGVRVIDQLVEDRQYDLAKDDIIVPPHLWESTIQPGSSVVMRSRGSVATKSTSWLRKSFRKTGV